MGQLDGKVAIITGAAQGMGENHARAFVEEGARVVVTDLQEEAGRELAGELGEAALFVAQDVTSEADWDRVVAAALERFGRIDALVNNAAIWWTATVLEETADGLRKMLEVNVVGVWLAMHKVAPAMRDSGGGAIVNISSTAGIHGIPEHGAYGASKWAVRGLTKVAAHELGPLGIRVNSVHPGGIKGTGMFQRPEEEHDAIFRHNPIPRAGERSEVSALVVFLASDASSYITGHEHVIDGGRQLW
ncbi:MAG: glucose 1-dehydrogenase [Proteobacteria bacterium]|nr:glucose 1-dehydrogenase [Pseudomonadota bacterium]